MIRQPTQPEEKPRSQMGSGSKRPRNSTKEVSINIRPRKKIDLDEICCDVGGGDYENMTSFEEPAECLICGLIVHHRTPSCPYRKSVPHIVSLPPGIQRVCKCCRKRDGHPGEDWKAYATPKKCFDCGTLGEHWTGDADCPTKAPNKHRRPTTAPNKYWDDEYQETGRPFLPLEERRRRRRPSLVFFFFFGFKQKTQDRKQQKKLRAMKQAPSFSIQDFTNATVGF